jgi:hypothetical protein
MARKPYLVAPHAAFTAEVVDVDDEPGRKGNWIVRIGATDSSGQEVRLTGEELEAVLRWWRRLR